MVFGLIIIGDEILSGRRQDRHMQNLLALLKQRGLQLGWVQILPDDFDLLVATFKQTVARGDVVFCTGGLGSTPDDLTREAMAKALGVVTELHPDGKETLEKWGQQHAVTLAPEHYQLVTFPKGSDLLQDSDEKYLGFSLFNHYFMPGFPEMAEPMMQWVLDNHYQHINNDQYVERSIVVMDVFESQLTPAMNDLLQRYPELKLFSLPMIDGGRNRVEVGLKGERVDVIAAMSELIHAIELLQFKWIEAE